jgi:fermentation-respiration switch protein FrsA (DUF1100 family)
VTWPCRAFISGLDSVYVNDILKSRTGQAWCSARYWKSWQGVESAKIAGSLKRVPALVLQGGRDYQVTQVDYDAFRTALRGRPNTAFHLYPDLNHLFQKGKGKAVPPEYLKPAPVDRRVIDDIAKWVKSIRG